LAMLENDIEISSGDYYCKDYDSKSCRILFRKTKRVQNLTIISTKNKK
jgi:hypothetical protein